jgi:hypothetical protein
MSTTSEPTVVRTKRDTTTGRSHDGMAWRAAPSSFSTSASRNAASSIGASWSLPKSCRRDDRLCDGEPLGSRNHAVDESPSRRRWSQVRVGTRPYRARARVSGRVGRWAPAIGPPADTRPPGGETGRLHPRSATRRRRSTSRRSSPARSRARFGLNAGRLLKALETPVATWGRGGFEPGPVGPPARGRACACRAAWESRRPVDGRFAGGRRLLRRSLWHYRDLNILDRYQAGIPLSAA